MIKIKKVQCIPIQNNDSNCKTKHCKNIKEWFEDLDYDIRRQNRKTAAWHRQNMANIKEWVHQHNCVKKKIPNPTKNLSSKHKYHEQKKKSPVFVHAYPVPKKDDLKPIEGKQGENDEDENDEDVDAVANVVVVVENSSEELENSSEELEYSSEELEEAKV